MFPDADLTVTIAAPVLRLPLSVEVGRFATLEHDSAAEIAQSVALLLDTPAGDRRVVPGYGIDGMLGELVVEVTESDVEAALATWEPRANPDEIIREVTPGIGQIDFTVHPTEISSREEV